MRVIRRDIAELSTFFIHYNYFRAGIRAVMVMTPILGLTWIFGILTNLHLVFDYFFTILVSTQVKS